MLRKLKPLCNQKTSSDMVIYGLSAGVVWSCPFGYDLHRRFVACWIYLAWVAFMFNNWPLPFLLFSYPAATSSENLGVEGPLRVVGMVARDRKGKGILADSHLDDPSALLLSFLSSLDRLIYTQAFDFLAEILSILSSRTSSQATHPVIHHIKLPKWRLTL